MSSTLFLSSLLAETHLAEVSLQYHEQDDSGGISGCWYLLIPVAVAIISAVVYKLVDRPPAIVNTPLGMLHELCRVHRIKGQSRTLLEQITEAADIKHPAIIFLGVSQFDAAVQKAKETIEFDRKQTGTLGFVRRRLFS